MSGANIFHMHIPKTAGTSLRMAFESNKYKVAPIGSEFSFDPRQHKDVDLFSGHVGFRVVEKSAVLRDRVITILRDPYDRALSYYYHLAMLHREGHENSPRTNLAAKYSLFEFLAIKDHPHIISDLYNAVTWQLVHDPDIDARMAYRLDQPRLTDSDLVERAKASLSSFLVVGFQTRMDAFAKDLRRATGFDHKLEVENANASRAAAETIDAETRRRLRAWIEMDVEVYNWALARFSRG